MASRPTPDFEELIAAVARELDARDIPFMLIGGQAVLLHGEPRLTADVDITLGVPPASLPVVSSAAHAAGLSILPEDPQTFVRDTFVLPVAQPKTGIRVDLIFSTTEYESQAIGRAVRTTVGGWDVPFASAEDLLLHKLFAGRPRDLEDVAGVVRRKGEQIDWEYVETWAREFAEIPGREALPDLVRRLRSSS